MALRNDTEAAEGRVKGFIGRSRAFCNSDALEVDEIVSVSKVTVGSIVVSVGIINEDLSRSSN